MNRPHHRLVGVAVLLQLTVALGLAATGSGCSSGSHATTGSGGSAAGGAASSGGASGTGGASGGSGGVSAGSGGITSSGGATGSGGTNASGGTAASGGTSGSGGVSASGGATAPGGAGGGGRGGTTANGGRGGAGQGGGGAAGAGGHTIPSTITLTSPVLVEGGTFPANITCADPGMRSPELDWTAGPAGTMSYAVTLTDLTEGRIDWAIWDIPVPGGDPTTVVLPANLDTVDMLTTPPGAIQTDDFQARGYFGPCTTGTTHTYRFQVYAIPTATLAGLSVHTMSPATASASIQAVALATGTLTATSSAHH